MDSPDVDDPFVERVIRSSAASVTSTAKFIRSLSEGFDASFERVFHALPDSLRVEGGKNHAVKSSNQLIAMIDYDAGPFQRENSLDEFTCF